jgi:hypothetical protein
MNWNQHEVANFAILQSWLLGLDSNQQPSG